MNETMKYSHDKGVLPLNK